MSLISEQVKEMRGKANHLWGSSIADTKCMLLDAANTIEELSNKLARANMDRSEKYYNMDLVDVIRCKDCKQWGTGFPAETESVKFCKYAGYMVIANGYCVYGEKK